MYFIFVALGILFAGGLLALLAGRGPVAGKVGAATALAAAAAGLAGAGQTLLAINTPSIEHHGFWLGPLADKVTLTAFSLPLGSFTFHLDGLGAFFLLPTFIVSAVCAVYGASTLNQNDSPHHLGLHWFFYSMLTAGLVVVFTAADAFLFLMGWEIMSLAPFFLLSLHHEQGAVRKGAWYYLIAAHLGALCLLAFFGLLSAYSGGSLAFADFNNLFGMFSFIAPIAATKTLLSPPLPNELLLALLAFVGFGAKAGLMPMHVWLPRAYPAAPGHIAGFMAGALSTSGIYGLIRTLALFQYTNFLFAELLIGAGAISIVLGILFSLAQPSIKRVLAYSSIENMGIVCLALGFGAKLYSSQPNLALLCYIAALLHLFNHSLYKTLLFLAADAVERATGTDTITLLGGLGKRMPVVSAFFALGAVAICALPPLNGFAGEFVLYVALALGGSFDAQSGMYYWGGLFVLAMAGGLAVVSFTRVYSLVFSGNPRTPATQLGQDPPALQRATLWVLGGLCVGSGLAVPMALNVISNIFWQLGLWSVIDDSYRKSLSYVSQFKLAPISSHDMPGLLLHINTGFALFAALVAGLLLLRRWLLRKREVTIAPTWDCGYSAPTPRMQYTAASFSQPMAVFMRSFLRQQNTTPTITDYFPSAATASTTTPDWVETGLYARLARLCLRAALWAKHMQHGRLNVYVLYILITLVVLLAWKMR
ncbi:proton-conducting transporter transmembrane domain-containing protein [Desulfovibrio cuneatus]|uniref:proton-conducting transporter transmembrane domain-containing protein n=1 Tax=Desulfovibrio cuneatus TaxID=159728 RepID=UPI00041E513B|nr:proton-conducting transporter membrane subunit [Desulfovibrio cuneatus]